MRKAQIELETIVKIVIIFVVLVVILLFFTGGFRSIGEKFEGTSGQVTGGASGVASEIGSAVTSGPGLCSVESDDGSPNCQVVVNHPTGCASGPDQSHTPSGVPFVNRVPPYMETLCSGKCELRIKTCFGSTFDYTVRDK